MFESGLKSKRCFDIVILVSAHLFLLPFWLILWIFIPIFIWLEDRGSIFFKQTRIGYKGTNFDVIKFRSMYMNAEDQGLITSDTDQRITKVGNVLRRTALDELPQIINILRGDMSFVGPRALPPKMHEESCEIVSEFEKRLSVLPGLTGIAQIYLSRHAHPRRRLAYDLIYLRRKNIFVDVTLMLLAAVNTVTGKWGTGHRKSGF
tara:strand:- start:74 stop:688 length:615 start_codon:yes stop_codon:yes gene_type:complete